MPVTHRSVVRIFRLLAVAAALITTGCGDTPSDAPAAETDPTIDRSAQLPPIDVVAALGYPRDLLDRGRLNVDISRSDDAELVIHDKQLVADYFAPVPAENRPTAIPPDHRVVSLQTSFGEVTDCESTQPLDAALEVTYRYGADPAIRSASLAFSDTAILELIRRQQCTVRQVLAENDLELTNAVVDGESMTVDLVIRRRTGAARLGFDAIKGTVLFGAETEFVSGAPERVLEADEQEAVIPLTLDVNRCDSHAVAETTRKFGVDLWVSVEGAEAQRIDVPVDAVLHDLELMLERCRTRTG